MLQLLAERNALIIDGALATELEIRGCDLNDSLWSTKVLLEQPELIQDVHEDYFKAGADIAITASYQATLQGLSQRGLDQARSQEVISRSVELARNARRLARASSPQREMLIAGSIGPYGAYLANGSEYRGDYELSQDTFMNFHRFRSRALISAGADVLAFETIPSFPEALAIIELLKEHPGTDAWMSFTLRDGMHISDGTSLEMLGPYLDHSPEIVACGFNCVPIELISPALTEMRKYTQKPLIAYPNSGEVWNSSENSWSGAKRLAFDTLVPQWQSSGAKVIGGCCRTGPDDIRAIARSIQSSHPVREGNS